MENNSKANYTKVRGLLTQLEEFKSAPDKEGWLTENTTPATLAKLRYGQEIVTELGDFERVAYKDNDYEENCTLHAVYHFKDHGVYIRFEGNYTSYEGANCEKVLHVEPTLVTKTEYLAVK